MQAKIPLPPGLLPKKAAWEISSTWFARGICTDKGERFRGEHAEYMLIIVDEANGVPSFVHEEAANMCTSPFNKIVMVGNPVSPEGEFYQAFSKENQTWKTMTISSMEHPNVRHHRQNIPGAVSWNWIDERVKKLCNKIEEKDKQPNDFEWPFGSGQWWKPSATFLGRVLGEFPEQGPDSLVSLSDINRATEIEIPIDDTAVIDIGVDVARKGGDSSVIVARQGPCVIAREKWDNRDTYYCTGRVSNMIKYYTEQGKQVGTVAVDAIGIGAGVADALSNLKEEGILRCDRVLAIQVSEKANNIEHYESKRTELAFALADRLKEGMLDLTRLHEGARDDFTFQTSQIKYEYTQSGQYKIEQKEKYRDRVGQSPDDFDAYCLAFVDVVDIFAENYVLSMCI